MRKSGSSDPPEFAVSETATEARQGVTGHGVRYVLAWSLVGVLIAFVIVLLVFFWH